MPNLKVKILKIICKLLLPKDIWLGHCKGVFTQEYEITFGKLDNRGVLQGIDITKQ